MTLSTTGRIVRIFPTITRKSKKTGELIRTRKFWIDAPGSDFGSAKPVQTVEMNIVNAEKPNPNFVSTDDLDKLSTGKVVRFTFNISSVFSLNRQNGEERCYTNLTVCSRLDVVGPRSPYSQAKKEEYERKCKEHEKVLEDAMKDYNENVANGNLMREPPKGKTL